MKTAIVLNGTELNLRIEERYIICADGGLRLLKDRAPDVVLGDFDSVGIVPHGVRTLRVPKEKNYTDGEMAVRYAAENGAEEVSIYGATGGRIDHVLANFALLKLAFTLGLKASIQDAAFWAEYVEGRVTRAAPVGSTVSLLPFGGSVSVKRSSGLYYPLNPLTISPEGMSRGMSNVTTAPKFTYDISEGGAFLIVYPN